MRPTIEATFIDAIQKITVSRIFILRCGSIIGAQQKQFGGGLHRVMGTGISIERTHHSFTKQWTKAKAFYIAQKVSQ